MPRDVWRSGGKQGLLGDDMEERHGGGGVRDFRYNAVIDEELVRIGASGVGFGLHNDVVGPTCATSLPRSRSSAGCPASAAGSSSPRSR